MKKLVLITLVLSQLLALALLAEDPQRGRLNDGRAFRIDAEGNQIVDYIAELEVTVEALNRQVIALQDELTDDRGKLTRLEGGKPAAPAALREIDLAGSAGPTTVTHELPVAPEFPTSSIDRSCQDELEILRGQVYNSNGSCGPLREAYEKELAWYKTVVKGYKNELAKTGQNKTEKEAALIEAKDSSVDPEALKAAEARISELEEALSESKASLADVAEKNQELQTKQQEAATVKVNAQDSSSRARARFVTDAPAANRSREHALTALRSNVRTELNQLNSLIRMRDNLYRTYSKNSRALSLQPSRAISGRYLTPAQIGALAQQATYPNELNNLKRDISQIEGLIKDDIATVKRLQQAG